MMPRRSCLRGLLSLSCRLSVVHRLLSIAFALLFLCISSPAQSTYDIPDTGWHLWLDRDAPWQNDSLVLPGDAQLSSLPVNIPTGGWESLHAPSAITLSNTTPRGRFALSRPMSRRSSSTFTLNPTFAFVTNVTPSSRITSSQVSVEHLSGEIL